MSEAVDLMKRYVAGGRYRVAAIESRPRNGSWAWLRRVRGQAIAEGEELSGELGDEEDIWVELRDEEDLMFAWTHGPL